MVKSCKRKVQHIYLKGTEVWPYLQDMFFDDESAEVVISSLQLGEEQDRYFEHYFICLLFP